MKLQLKHLAPYLPYGLKLAKSDNKPFNIEVMTGLNSGVVMINHDTLGWNDFEDIKPILRNLSDLTKEIYHNGKTFKPSFILTKVFKVADEYLIQLAFLSISNNKKELNDFIAFCPNIILQYLHEWHFDTEGLIEEELAVDLNTLKEKEVA